MFTKQTSKILALLMAVCLVFTMMPLSVMAEGAELTGDSGGEIIATDGAATQTNTPDSVTPGDNDLPLGTSGDTATPAIITVAAFDALPEETEWQNYDYGEVEFEDDLTLPKTLTATDTDDEPLTIEGVTWESDPAFDPETARAYWFSPVLPEVYSLAEDVTAPVITVIIKPEGGMQVQPQLTSGTMTIDGALVSNLANPASGIGWSWTANTDTLTLGSDYTGGAIDINCQTTDTVNLVYSGNVTISSATASALSCAGNLNISESGSGGTLTATTSDQSGGGIVSGAGSGD
ncbi:MAG: hypothetical protein LBS19_05185, partial [Clostridiales bacterium]|nr:hypothetical protein [Clostridiales bacterium]